MQRHRLPMRRRRLHDDERTALTRIASDEDVSWSRLLTLEGRGLVFLERGRRAKLSPKGRRALRTGWVQTF